MYAEEWECYSRILSTGVKGIQIKKDLYFGRKHLQSNTGEYWNNSPLRRSSEITAVNLVVRHLQREGLLSRSLVRFFVQKGIFLKNRTIIKNILEASNSGFFKKLKYELLYEFYPIIGRVHRTKKIIKAVFQ